MVKQLDSFSEKILDFLKEHQYENYTWTDIGREVGLHHPQKVIHRIKQLEKKGYIRKDYDNDVYVVMDKPAKEVIYLPLYGSALCGNIGKAGLSETPEEVMPVSTRILNIVDPDDYFLVRAEGKSMEPLIKEGDIVLVKYGERQEGQISLVVHNDTPKIKTLVAHGNTHLLVSKNKDTKAVEVDVEDEDGMRVIGAVKKVISTV